MTGDHDDLSRRFERGLKVPISVLMEKVVCPPTLATCLGVTQ